MVFKSAQVMQIIHGSKKRYIDKDTVWQLKTKVIYSLLKINPVILIEVNDWFFGV
jgi:hypothetical protein